jgi:two-component sensor histidine kinase
VTTTLAELSKRWLEAPPSWRGAFAWGLGLIGLGVALRIILLPVIGPGFPYVTFFPAVVFASALGGFRGGLIAVTAALLSAWFLFLPPRFSFELRTSGDALSLVVFTCNVSAGALCAALLRSAVVRVAASERRHEMMVQELNHRVKNNLATVLSIARQTGRYAQSLEGFLATFQVRVTALSRSHELLAGSEWSGLDIREIIEAELAAYAAVSGEPARTTVAGPPLTLSAAQAVGLGMIVHELTTNSAKHGALSQDGQVEVEWSNVGDKRWRLLWRERGGPPVSAPVRIGFGSTLIPRLAASTLRGSAELHFDPDGLVASVLFSPELSSSLQSGGW